ncbi:MAG TPA: phosphoribosylformylglycinamidine synthase subunit PurQ [Terriglobia bacterium]|nr:phosphoribosylformylglycinamidine synthase subunit PurQ [Terriglobia bacterium]
MKFGVVVFPGSNCEQDCHYAIGLVLRKPVDYIWHQETSVKGFDAVVLPGGFAYGDYLRTGALAKFSPVMKAIADFAKKGGLVIGICNGFQILTEAGLLPGALLRNIGLKYLCRFEYLRTETTGTPFTNLMRKGQLLRIPIGHGEGNFFADGDTLKRIEDNDQVVFRYADANSHVTPEANPNGSLNNIAGIVNEARNVIGMMPHPDRSYESILGSADGKLIFESMVNALVTK